MGSYKGPVVCEVNPDKLSFLFLHFHSLLSSLLLHSLFCGCTFWTGWYISSETASLFELLFPHIWSVTLLLLVLVLPRTPALHPCLTLCVLVPQGASFKVLLPQGLPSSHRFQLPHSDFLMLCIILLSRFSCVGLCATP